MTRVCVVTGTRAEYGLLRWLMQGIADSDTLTLQVIATGAHLSPEFGLTYREIEADGFVIDAKVDMLLSSDTTVAVTKSMGLGLIGLADAYARLQPDLVVVLGDRYETWCAAAAAMVARIPIAHIHGGEVTEGAIDEAMRHGITKMAHLHFVAAPAYRNRVVQLGEDPDRVFVVGGLGLDSIDRLDLLDRQQLEEALDFSLGERSLLIGLHPVTLDGVPSQVAMGELLAALADQRDTQLIFTMPNADTDGRVIQSMIVDFVAANPNAKAFTSLGQVRFLSCLQHVDAVVGNSSSGLLEAPSFHTPTINIGSRQRGRLEASSVITCEPTRESIGAALDRLDDEEFQALVAEAVNPYGTPGASRAIVDVIERTSTDDLLIKRFHDLG
jgi:GDP/UDP-N,N'-diacetylbacillosamine 2-epimerase (hydrolysing)